MKSYGGFIKTVNPTTRPWLKNREEKKSDREGEHAPVHCQFALQLTAAFEFIYSLL